METGHRERRRHSRLPRLDARGPIDHTPLGPRLHPRWRRWHRYAAHAFGERGRTVSCRPAARADSARSHQRTSGPKITSGLSVALTITRRRRPVLRPSSALRLGCRTRPARSCAAGIRRGGRPPGLPQWRGPAVCVLPVRPGDIPPAHWSEGPVPSCAELGGGRAAARPACCPVRGGTPERLRRGWRARSELPCRRFSQLRPDRRLRRAGCARSRAVPSATSLRQPTHEPARTLVPLSRCTVDRPADTTTHRRDSCTAQVSPRGHFPWHPLRAGAGGWSVRFCREYAGDCGRASRADRCIVGPTPLRVSVFPASDRSARCAAS